ncbi:MAG: bifunctional tetrahydrofolate synthase/dihydrofolate synthase [Zoogloeaceae bacterium]|jgi:dihydrofolate synthase/folylpolyglutamate synthase|nr:bifunctional tetrahydrofolate synthase/dihydrofolate synthase [Zoogloeaceae bacterium]
MRATHAAVLPADLPGWLMYLESLHPKGEAGIELGLQRVREVGAALGQRPFCPIFTLAGTNGKGSTAVYLEMILVRAGYRVGCYTSPHLLRFTERVRINGEEARAESLCAAFAEVERARKAAGNAALTYFEFATLAAWQIFSAAKCEALILEVGLGGRLDAVNLYDPDVALLTSIDLDHQQWLGATREEIGLEKAGIFRSGHPAFCGDAHPPESVLRQAATLKVPLFVAGRDFGWQKTTDAPLQWQYWRKTPEKLERRILAHPNLRGAAQINNASLALAALDALRERLPVSAQAIREGLARAELPGRFQVLPGRPVIVLDAGHNPEALRVLAENLDDMGFFANTYAVLGMLADKDAINSLAALKGKVTRWFIATLTGIRGQKADALADKLLAADSSALLSCYESPEDAFDHARETAKESDRIIVIGSFHTLAAVWRRLESSLKRPKVF